MRTSAIPSYQGEEPYIAVCFADADRKQVLPLLADLYARHFRIAFFENADCSGAEADRIASMIARASLVLLFLSDNATNPPVAV